MTRTEFVERFVKIASRGGRDQREEAECYARMYPASEWPAILEWVPRAPDLDACDDVEVDVHHA